MAKSIPLQTISKILGKGLSKVNPATFAVTSAVETGQQLSKEQFGYDFVGLGIKLFIYFTVALLFAKFMEGVLFAKGIFISLANLFGANLPSDQDIPDSLKKLFNGGIGGFKFWDIVKIVAVLLVITEMIRYIHLTQKSSPMTLGLFGLIITALILITIPELIARIRKTDLNLEAFK